MGVGGSSELGAIGHVLAGIELAQQSVAEGIRPSVVVLPSATGGTQAGLLVGLASASIDTSVLGMAVARPADELRTMIDRAGGGTLRPRRRR